MAYKYIDPDAIHELHGSRIGMIAQEVEAVFLDGVEASGVGYKMLTFQGFEALTVEAQREESARHLAKRDARLGAMESENRDLRPRHRALEDRVLRVESVVLQLAGQMAA